MSLSIWSGSLSQRVATVTRTWNHSRHRLLFSNRSQPAPAESEIMIPGTNMESLGETIRHGKGDAYITLSVGGTEFHTLRSTINSNAVLADHVARAEANTEITHKGAVFIDRDPAHFGIILQYLRNHVESITYSSSRGVAAAFTTQTYLQLPKDINKLNDLYVEASYFTIPELQKALCAQNWLVNLTQLFGGGNPFTAASKTLARLKASLVALSGTVLIGSQGGLEFDKFLGLVGLQKKDLETQLAKQNESRN